MNWEYVAVFFLGTFTGACAFSLLISLIEDSKRRDSWYREQMSPCLHCGEYLLNCLHGAPDKCCEKCHHHANPESEHARQWRERDDVE